MTKPIVDAQGNWARDRMQLMRERYRSKLEHRLPEDFPTVEDMTPETPAEFERLARETKEADQY